MSTLGMVPVDRLRPHPDNIRDDLGDLDELATSIRTRGVLQPLVVAQTGSGFIVIDGHRRLAAAQMAGVTAVPCLATKVGDAARDTALMLAAAMHKGLTPLERAKAFKRLRRRGMSVAEIARHSGYSTKTVSDGLLLADLPPEVHEQVEDKRMTVAAAAKVARDVRNTARGSAPSSPKVPWLTADHRLASMVRNSCGHGDSRVRVGGVGCGQCWEDAIRFDERERAARRAAS